VDYLTLHTGKKFQIPFDVLTAFATNLDPASLADEAFLRRIPYKIAVGRPLDRRFHQDLRVELQAAQPRLSPGDGRRTSIAVTTGRCNARFARASHAISSSRSPHCAAIGTRRRALRARRWMLPARRISSINRRKARPADVRQPRRAEHQLEAR
jgi:hypothetical protein